MPAPFSKVGEVLRRLAPRLGLETRLLERLVRQRWEGIVGDQVARHTQPGSIRFKKLTVHARNSIWVQQLTFLKPTLLEKINEAAGGPVIADLVLRVGELEDGRPDQRGPGTGGQERAAAPPSQAELEDAARRVQAVRDEDLRGRLLRLIAAAPPATAGWVTSAPRPPKAPPPRIDRSRPAP